MSNQSTPKWATHILRHIPSGLLFYGNGDAKEHTAISFQPLDKDKAVAWFTGKLFPGHVSDWDVDTFIRGCHSQHDLHQMIIDQNPERRSEQRKPVTSFDWELTQALNHLQNAITVTSADRAHKLLAAKNIIKGVREAE